MNRYKDYLNLLVKHRTQSPIKPLPESFYDTINRKIDALDRSLNLTNRYTAILSIEDKFQALLIEIQGLVKNVEIEGNTDESLHFIGIKYILNIKMNKLNKKIKEKKAEGSRLKVELEPEPVMRPSTNVCENSMLKAEGTKILEKHEDTAIQKTIRRLVEIQSLQDLIGIHLEAQNERVDDIVVRTEQAKKDVKLGGKYLSEGTGSVFRRSLCTFILCLTFVILFCWWHSRS